MIPYDSKFLLAIRQGDLCIDSKPAWKRLRTVINLSLCVTVLRKTINIENRSIVIVVRIRLV